jgi:putative FmdB family regulatory protein
MPIYEYTCENCNKTTEHIHKYNEAPAIICETCKQECKRIISLSSFRLSGDGWTMPYKPMED